MSQIVLADEINRATPRHQLGPARGHARAPGHRKMGVTASCPLPSLIGPRATQNPIELEGTFPLPEGAG